MSEDGPIGGGRLGIKAIHDARRRREEAAAANNPSSSSQSSIPQRSISPTNRPESARNPIGPLEPLRQNSSSTSRPQTASSSQRLGLGLNSLTNNIQASIDTSMSPKNNNNIIHEDIIRSEVSSWLNLNASKLLFEFFQNQSNQSLIQQSLIANLQSMNINGNNQISVQHSSNKRKPEESLESSSLNNDNSNLSGNTFMSSRSNTGPLSSSNTELYQSKNEDSFDHQIEHDPRTVLANKYKQQFNDSPISANSSFINNNNNNNANIDNMTMSNNNNNNQLDQRQAKRQSNSIRTSVSAGGSKLGLGLGLGSSQSSLSSSSNNSISQSSSPSTRQTSINSSSSSSSSSGCDCLLVEDVRVSQRIASAALSRAHYKVDVASDGESAIEKYKIHCQTLKVVLMDIHMPGISGIEATQKIREFEQSNGLPTCLVYGLTGNVDEDNLRLYQSAGMNGCIVKGKLLVDAVKQAVQISERMGNQHFVNLSNTTRPDATTLPPQNQSSNSSTNESSPDIKTHHNHSISSSNSTSNDSSMRDHQSSNSTTTNRPNQNIQSLSNSSNAMIDIDSSSSSNFPSSTNYEIFIPGQSMGPDLLLVEDVRVSQRVASQALSRAHYKVEVASDGESAIEKYKSHLSSLRIILMDVGLPGISGIEATEEIRKFENLTNQSQKIWIFGLTGNVDAENLKEYKQIGMNGCILKGKLIVDAVKQAISQIQKNPNQFINLSQSTTATTTIASPSIDSTTISSQSNSQNNNSNNSTSLSKYSSSDKPLSSIPSDIRAQQYAAASSSSASLGDVSSADLIGTPRAAAQPRALLASKFSGRGTVRPGIGLPSAATSQQQQQQQSSSASSSPVSSTSTSSSNDQNISSVVPAGMALNDDTDLTLMPRRSSPKITSQIKNDLNSLPSSSSPIQIQSGLANGPDLLLVEDVRVSQKLASQALSRAHYKVEVASDGESAIEKYKSYSSSIKIILMDVGLPGISGIEATERIRHWQQNQLPNDSNSLFIFGLTGNVNESNLIAYENAGMNGCIVKGKLLVDAVKEATQKCQRNPNIFVNLISRQS